MPEEGPDSRTASHKNYDFPISDLIIPQKEPLLALFYVPTALQLTKACIASKTILPFRHIHQLHLFDSLTLDIQSLCINYMEREEFKQALSPFDWDIHFLTWMTQGLRQHLYRLPLNQGDKIFTEAICDEYAVDTQLDLETAYKKYQMAAGMDHSLSIYKLAEQELLQWTHGRRQNRDEEMYLRFRAYAFLDPTQDPKGLDISNEIAKYMRQYDPGRVKLGELFARLEGRKEAVDIAYIKAKIGLLALDQEEIEKAVNLLALLVSKYNHLDAAFTLAILYSQSNGLLEHDDSKAGEYYKLCQNCRYHKAYTSLGEFLLKHGHKQEAFNIFKEAMSFGYYGGQIYLLSARFRELDKRKQLHKLIDAYIPSIVTGSTLCILNFLHLRCISKMDPVYYNKEHDLLETEIIQSIKDLYEHQRLKEIKNKDDFVMAYVLTVSLGLVSSQLDQEDILINEAFHETESPWLKRYCITNLMEVRRRMYVQNPTPERAEVLKKTEASLATHYLNQLNNNQTTSYFYYLAHIYKNGWGVQQSKLLYYLCICKAAEGADSEKVGPLFLQHYKSQQAKEQVSGITELPQIAALCQKVKKDLGENRTCDICYQRTKEVFFHECGHYCCCQCYKLILKEKGICHMCRKPVKMVNLIQRVLRFG